MSTDEADALAAVPMVTAASPADREEVSAEATAPTGNARKLHLYNPYYLNRGYEYGYYNPYAYYGYGYGYPSYYSSGYY